MKHPLVVVGFLACGYGKGFLHASHSHPHVCVWVPRAVAAKTTL